MRYVDVCLMRETGALPRFLIRRIVESRLLNNIDDNDTT